MIVNVMTEKLDLNLKNMTERPVVLEMARFVRQENLHLSCHGDGSVVIRN